MKYYIYKDFVLNEDDFLEKAKKDYKNEEEDIKEGWTFEEYVEDIIILDYNVLRVLDINEEELKKCRYISDLDCAVLDILTGDLSQDIHNEEVQKYIDRISMQYEYNEAIKNEYWQYNAFDNWILTIKFDVLKYVPWEDEEYTEIKYKGFEIEKIGA